MNREERRVNSSNGVEKNKERGKEEEREGGWEE